MSDSIEEGCIRCLSYFGIFRYPLTAEEVHRFLPLPAEEEAVREALQKLVEEKIIYFYDGYFLPEDDRSRVAERFRGNEKALLLLGKTGRYARIISFFPFVRAIAVSGSLSKFHASENADIDYFIITDRNRLWIARTLLHLFKKLTFITGHQHYFCMNYFIDTGSLELENRNLYSAVEAVTLLPVYGQDLCERFERSNTWVSDFLPNHPGMNNFFYLMKKRRQPIKHFIEKVLNIMAPEKTNRFLMNVTDRKWRRKWRGHGYSQEDYNRAFQTELHISRNHPDDYEKQVLDSLQGHRLRKEVP